MLNFPLPPWAQPLRAMCFLSVSKYDVLGWEYHVE